MTVMTAPISTALAILAVALMVLAVFAMSAGRLTAAGMSFLSASIVIYLRETRVRDGETTG